MPNDSVGSIGLDIELQEADVGKSVENLAKRASVFITKELEKAASRIDSRFNSLSSSISASFEKTAEKTSSFIGKELEKVTEKIDSRFDDLNTGISGSFDKTTKTVGDRFEKSIEGLSQSINKKAEKSARSTESIVYRSGGKINSFFGKLTNRVHGSVSNLSNSISSSAKSIGLTLGAAFSVKVLTNFGKSCIDLGSDLAEVQNVVDVTFKRMSGSVDKWAKNAQADFGLSETMAKKFVGTYGSMAETFGFTEEQAFDMSTALTGLAGDVASFYNISQNMAYSKLKSVFSGETEALKDLGVVMTQTALDSYALSKGIGKTTAKMTEAEKVSLRYSFITDQLANASGDFSRTSTGWANQTRVLQLRFESLKATLGQSFITILNPLLTKFNSLLDVIQKAADKFNDFIRLTFGLNSDAGGTGSALAEAANAANSLDEGTDGAAKGLADADKSAKKLKNNLAGFDRLNIISSNKDKTDNSVTNSGSGGSGGSDGSLNTAVKIDTKDLDKTRSKLSAIKKKLRTLGFDKLAKSAKTAGGAVLSTVRSIGSSWKRVWSNGTGTRVLKRINSLLSTGLGIIGDISGAFKKSWDKGKLGDGVIQSFIDRADSFLELLETIGRKTPSLCFKAYTLTHCIHCAFSDSQREDRIPEPDRERYNKQQRTQGDRHLLE